jgi:hypothetical protein
MFLHKHSKTTPMWTEEGLPKNNSHCRTLTIGCGLILVWEHVEKKLEFLTFFT